MKNKEQIFKNLTQKIYNKLEDEYIAQSQFTTKYYNLIDKTNQSTKNKNNGSILINKQNKKDPPGFGLKERY